MPRKEGRTFTAQGNIPVSTFVKADGTNDFSCVAATASTDKLLGISQAGSHDTPGLSGATAYAAASGQVLEVYDVGNMCLLLIGSGGCTPGDLLTSDASSRGVVATTGNHYGARADQTGALNEYVRVEVLIGTA